MPPIPKPTASTVRAIYAAYEAAAEYWDSLGISVGAANDPCDRSLFYTLRWATAPEKFTGRQLRLFETGNREEARLTEDLERIGVEVYGDQDRIRLAGGHIRGKRDGAAMGVPEAPKTEHLLEFKSTNAKGMKEIQKHGCEKAKPLHYGQCQLGMHYFGNTRALYLVACKDSDTLYAERIKYDPEFCMRLIARIERIIATDQPPLGISRKPDHPGCMFCAHRGVCHDGAWPRVTCRSCLHSTPIIDGQNADWTCARFTKPLSFDEQKEACPAHLHIPGMVPGEMISADQEAESVTYRLRNGEIWVDGAAGE